MAPPHNDADAAGNADVPMEVDEDMMAMMRELVVRGGLTADRIRAFARREQGEEVTQGDLAELGQKICDKVLNTDQQIFTRQREAELDSNRRRTEMAADPDHSDEHNELYNELYPLDSCVPADSRHMGKQISSLAATLREKRRAGGLRMDSAPDWVRTRQELDETFRDARLGGNEMAKCWLAFEVASPATRSNMKDLQLIAELRRNPKLANYNKHFVQPQNYCYNVLSTSANARNSLFRQRPKQASHEDVAAWHRRLVALGTEGFGDIGQWTREQRNVVTDCFVRRSRHSTLLEMHVDRDRLEAATASSRASHLDSLSRLCGENSLSDRHVHPLDNYHLTTAAPAGTSAAPASLPTDASSEPKPQPWFKKNNRRNAERPPRTADRVTWIKKDGRCATCNQDDEHPQPCSRPRVCWICNSPDHSRADCPNRPAQPAGGDGRPSAGRPKKPGVNQVRRLPEAAQPLMSSEPRVEQLCAAAPSQASSMSDVPSHIAVDFIASAASKLRSVYGLAGMWDSGQLTSHDVVMKTSFFLTWFGDENAIEPYLCDNLSPDFLIGRKALSRWNLSVNYYNNNQESWHAGDHRVMAMSAREAAEKA
jgi:hypothetical protein